MRRGKAANRFCSHGCSNGWPKPTPIWIVDCRSCERTFVARQRNRVLCGRDECKKREGQRAALATYHRRYASLGRVPDSFLRNAHIRRQRLADNGPFDETITIDWLIARDYGLCQLCGQCVTTGRNKPTIDHIIPVSLGGAHIKSNVQLACWLCNASKGARLT